MTERYIFEVLFDGVPMRSPAGPAKEESLFEGFVYWSQFAQEYLAINPETKIALQVTDLKTCAVTNYHYDQGRGFAPDQDCREPA